MLDQQFKVNPDYYEFANKNFVALHLLVTDEKNKELFDLYSANSTPTVIVAENNGKEIDRIVGYNNPPSTFLFYLKQAYNRADTFEQLSARYEKDKNDYETAIKLALKYEKSDSLDYLAPKIYEEILNNEEKAKATMIPYLDTGEEVSAYEWAMYRFGAVNLDMSLWKTLMDEYPNTVFIPRMYSFLFNSGFVNALDSVEVKEFYENALEHHPDNPHLLDSFVGFAAESGWNLAEASKAADKLQDEYYIFLANFNLIYRYHAEILDQLGDKESAARVFGSNYLTRLLSHINSDLYVYISYWLEEGGNEEALDTAIETLTKLDKDGRNINRLARAYIGADNMDKALEIFGPDYISEKWDDQDVLNNYVLFWTRQETNLESTLEAAKRMLEIPGDVRTGVIGPGISTDLEKVAKIYLLMGKDQEALNIYGPDYIKEYENDIPILAYYESFWFYEKKNLKSTVWAATKIAETQNRAFSWDRVARVYELMEDYENALKAELKAVEIEGDKSDRYKKRAEEIKKKIKKK